MKAGFLSFQKMPYFLYSWLQKIEYLILIHVTDDLNSWRSLVVRQTRHLSKLRKAWRSMFACTAMHFQSHKFCIKYKYPGERFFKNRNMSLETIFSPSKTGQHTEMNVGEIKKLWSRRQGTIKPSHNTWSLNSERKPQTYNTLSCVI